MNDANAVAAAKRPLLNHLVFWPPFVLLVLAIIANFVAPDWYL
jgi:hypothetical protein